MAARSLQAIARARREKAKANRAAEKKRDTYNKHLAMLSKRFRDSVRNVDRDLQIFQKVVFDIHILYRNLTLDADVFRLLPARPMKAMAAAIKAMKAKKPKTSVLPLTNE